MSRSLLPWIALLVSTTLIGCSKPEAGTTPTETLKLYRDRLQSGDRSGFLACISSSNDDEAKLMGVFFDFNNAGYRFRDAILAGHGQVAWERFQEKRGGTDIHLNLTEFPADWLESIQITINGSRADALLPGGTQPLKMVQRDGRWYIEASNFMPPADQLASTLKGLNASTKVIRQFTDEARKTDTDVDDLEKRMAVALAAEMRMLPASRPATE